jgi:hypothetical protein
MMKWIDSKLGNLSVDLVCRGAPVWTVKLVLNAQIIVQKFMR